MDGFKMKLIELKAEHSFAALHSYWIIMLVSVQLGITALVDLTYKTTKDVLFTKCQQQT